MMPLGVVFASRRVNAAGMLPSPNNRLPVPKVLAHLLAHYLAKGLVKQRNRPPAGRTTTACVLLRPAGTLHNAIQCDECQNDNFSHVLLLFCFFMYQIVIVCHVQRAMSCTKTTSAQAGFSEGSGRVFARYSASASASDAAGQNSLPAQPYLEWKHLPAGGR